MEVYNLPRPTWTQRGREQVRQERRELGFPESGPVKVVDVALAVKILSGQQKWRAYCFEVLLTSILLALLLVYALWARVIENGYFVARSVERQLDKTFEFEQITFDLNTPLNTSRGFGTFSNGEAVSTFTNLDPVTLQPVRVQASLKYSRCDAKGDASNASTLETGWCIRYNRTRKFETVRSLPEYVAWISTALEKSAMFSYVQRDMTRTPILLGTVRIRQLRSKSSFDLVRSTADENTSPIMCSSTPDSAFVPQSALAYRSEQAMNSFPSPIQQGKVMQSAGVPNLARRLDFYYPGDGYAFDLPKCDGARLRRVFQALVQDCDWFSQNFTPTVFVSLTVYESVSDSYVFAQYSYERFPQGLQVTSKDVRVFRIPGGSSDEAYIWRIVLCAFSLAQLVFFLGRAAHRACTESWILAGADRWFLLDVLSLSIIQTAVWLSISNSQNPSVQAVYSPEATAVLANCSYTDYVPVFNAISYDEKTEDLLLGISLVLQGLKFFQVCQLSARLSAAYSIINTIGREILWWFILTSCFFFFFAFGANILFGVYLAQFFTLPASLASTFLIFSKVPKYSLNFGDTSNILGRDFWAEFERPNLAAMVWDMAEFSRTFEINVLFGFAFWLGAVVVFIYWIMRNLLLGAVLSGYEIVKRNIEAEEMDAAERRMVRNARMYLLSERLQKTSLLKRVTDVFRRVLWRVLNTSKLDQLLVVLSSDPAYKRRGFATEMEIIQIFRGVGIMKRHVDPSPTLIRELNSGGDSGELFVANFLASFEFILDAVDEAILLLIEQEMPFALPLSAVSDIRRARTIEEAVDLLVDKAAIEFQPYAYCLPFAQELGLVMSAPERKPALLQRILHLAKATGNSTISADDSSGFFDVQLLTRRLCARLSDASEQAIARHLDKALSLSNPGPMAFDDCIDLFLDAVTNELGLYLDAVPDRDQVRVLAGRELRKSRRTVDGPLGRVTDVPAERFTEVFPCMLASWRDCPSPAEMHRCRSLFAERLDAERAQSLAFSLPSNNGLSGNGSDFDEDDGEEEASSFGSDHGTALDGNSAEGVDSVSVTVGEERASKVREPRAVVDETMVQVLEDNFDPTAQQRWEDAVFTGNFVLTLTAIHAIRSSILADQLTRELIALERSQVDLEKELLQSRLELDDRVASRKPMAAGGVRQVKKHGIEPHPKDKTYHVHFVHPRTREYKFVGVFSTQEEAEAAMTRTIEMENSNPAMASAASTSFSGGWKRQGSDADEKLPREGDSWQSDDMNYGAMARKARLMKKQELARRHKGDMVEAGLEDTPEDPKHRGNQARAEAKTGRVVEEEADEDEDEDGESAQEKDAEAERLEDELGVNTNKSDNAANRLSRSGQRLYERVLSGLSSACYSIVHWWNRTNETRLHYDITNEVWRDVHDEPVKVITKPKTVLPLAGKRWQKLQGDYTK